MRSSGTGSAVASAALVPALVSITLLFTSLVSTRLLSSLASAAQTISSSFSRPSTCPRSDGTQMERTSACDRWCRSGGLWVSKRHGKHGGGLQPRGRGIETGARTRMPTGAIHSRARNHRTKPVNLKNQTCVRDGGVYGER